jgi:hypothetical protein
MNTIRFQTRMACGDGHTPLARGSLLGVALRLLKNISGPVIGYHQNPMLAGTISALEVASMVLFPSNNLASFAVSSGVTSRTDEPSFGCQEVGD